MTALFDLQVQNLDVSQVRLTHHGFFASTEILILPMLPCLLVPFSTLPLIFRRDLKGGEANDAIPR